MTDKDDGGNGGDVNLIYGTAHENDSIVPFYDHVFNTIADGEVLRFTKEGEIRVHGEVIATDWEFVTAFFNAFRQVVFDKEQRDPDSGHVCNWSPGHGGEPVRQGTRGADGRVRFTSGDQKLDYLRLENGRILSRGEPIDPSGVMYALWEWMRDVA